MKTAGNTVGEIDPLRDDVLYPEPKRRDLLDEHGTGGTQYYLTNYQGSIMALVSASGTSFNGSYIYGPYGEDDSECANQAGVLQQTTHGNTWVVTRHTRK